MLCFAWNGKQTCSLRLLHSGNSIPDIFSLGKEGWRVLAGLRSCKCIKLHQSMPCTSSANREPQTLRCPSPAGNDTKEGSNPLEATILRTPAHTQRQPRVQCMLRTEIPKSANGTKTTKSPDLQSHLCELVYVSTKQMQIFRNTLTPA